jgi:chloramphenicol O-acetyltransferase
MIFTISKIYFEAVRQDTTTRYLYIKQQVLEFIVAFRGVDICTINNHTHVEMIFQFDSQPLQQRDPPLYTTSFTEFFAKCKNHWLRKYIYSKFPSDSVFVLI